MKVPNVLRLTRVVTLTKLAGIAVATITAL